MKQGNRNKPFKFEAFWLREPTFIEKMEWWNESEKEGRNLMHTFQLGLKDLKGKIKKWNKDEFGNIHQAQELIQVKIKKVQLQIINEGRSELLA